MPRRTPRRKAFGADLGVMLNRARAPKWPPTAFGKKAAPVKKPEPSDTPIGWGQTGTKKRRKGIGFGNE